MILDPNKSLLENIRQHFPNLSSDAIASINIAGKDDKLIELSADKRRAIFTYFSGLIRDSNTPHNLAQAYRLIDDGLMQPSETILLADSKDTMTKAWNEAQQLQVVAAPEVKALPQVSLFRPKLVEATMQVSSGSAWNLLNERLRCIRLQDDERGFCLLCAAEAARVLLSDKNYKPKRIIRSGDGDDKFDDMQEEAVLGKEALKTARNFSSKYPDRLLAYLQSDAVKPGSVFVAGDEEDHVFNFYKTESGNIFLIDSDSRLTLAINSVNDFQVEKGVVTETEYNYITDTESGYITLYYMGQIHADWREKLSSDNKSTPQLGQ